jgi:CHASE2 domain-containing sensor protein
MFGKRWSKRRLRETWAAGKWGAVLAAVFGVVFLLLRTPLERWSYDLPQLGRPQVEIKEVAIVFMDDVSHALRNQPYDGAWDRSLQAELVDVLRKSGAKAIAFDVLFSDPGTNAAATEALAAAIRAHGRVVLGVDLGSGDYYSLATEVRVIQPHPKFLAATPHWGFVQLKLDRDDAVREHFHGSEDIPSLSWKLASLLGAECTKEPGGQRKLRWLNYYGKPGTLPGLSFNKALQISDPGVTNFFHNRVVFIGSATQSGFSGKRRDQFRTPWPEPLSPGVEFHATQFLNLMRGDWLRRMDPLAELGVVIVFGFVAGLGLARFRPLAATMWSAAGAVFVTFAACLLVWQTHIWFAWLVLVAIQVPTALISAIVWRTERAEIARAAVAPLPELTTDFSASGSAMRVADHELLLRVGSGSYGEVWLARSATGTFRAVKIVDRKSAHDPHFEREFAGLKKFEPISRAHRGLVNILHVARNEAELYYVMELADSCAGDPNLDPENYAPTTLKTKIKSARALEAKEIARLSLGLTSALAFLHEQGLIHRDIKPSNIIFVNGEPKLADIGLVAAADQTLSFVGTEGYIPPEGPGTPAADVFSLGKVLGELLAEASPGTVGEEKMFRLSQVIERASARDVRQRYQNAQEMLVHLTEHSIV